jgi:hypothetical protein
VVALATAAAAALVRLVLFICHWTQRSLNAWGAGAILPSP